MSILMQSRVVFASGKAVRVDDLPSEVLKTLPWRVVQKIRAAFQRRYLEYERDSIDTWIRNVIVLVPNKKGIEESER